MWSFQIFCTHRTAHKLLNCHITLYFNHTVIEFHNLSPILSVSDSPDWEVHIVHSSYTILHPQISGLAICHCSTPTTVTYLADSEENRKSTHTPLAACNLPLIRSSDLVPHKGHAYWNISSNESRLAYEAQKFRTFHAMNHNLHLKHAKLQWITICKWSTRSSHIHAIK